MFANTGLGDLYFSGTLLTWCNNHDGESRTYTKLDRIQVNYHWLQHFQSSHAMFLPSEISDHSPGVVYLIGNQGYKRFPFRYCKA